MNNASGVKHISDVDFETEVSGDIPVLVDFWAPWCGPCRMLAPVLDSIARRYQGKLKVCKLNTDENPEIPTRFGIRGIPTLIFFRNGQEAERIVGYLTEDKLAQAVDKLLG
uniref:Thioredoxin n=1 Tax=candidate division WOR-3 bacterium TaxID=2052148 RepID=A0A7C4GGW1_UNCW3